MIMYNIYLQSTRYLRIADHDNMCLKDLVSNISTYYLDIYNIHVVNMYNLLNDPN